MKKTFKEWKGNLPLWNQLLVSFLLYVIFWFLGPLLWDNFIWHNDRPIKYYLLFAPFQAVIFTIIFNWKKIKSLF
jgi:hypothetical protein